MTNHLTEELAAKIDAFAEALDAGEQAVLAQLLSNQDPDEVDGFGVLSTPVGGWPGATRLIAFGNDTTSLRHDPQGLVSFGAETTP